jgi:hypothetical protein
MTLPLKGHPTSTFTYFLLYNLQCQSLYAFFTTTVILSGLNKLSGIIIAQSFADDSVPDPIFMSAFVKCVTYNDFLLDLNAMATKSFLALNFRYAGTCAYDVIHISLVFDIGSCYNVQPFPHVGDF